MSKFVRWSGIAHSILLKSHPKIKLGQTREILSAYLGHRTYASFRLRDLAALEEAKYVLVDPERALHRATSLNVALTADGWNAVETALSPSGVSGGAWIVPKSAMHLAAQLTFEDSGDHRLHEIGSSLGFRDGLITTRTIAQSAETDYPDHLRFTVKGEVRRLGDDQHLAVPVTVEVEFQRIGNQLYTAGTLYAVAQSGPPTEYEPEEPIYEFSGIYD